MSHHLAAAHDDDATAAVADLTARAAGAVDVAGLADVVVDWLEERGLPLSSVYLEQAGRLRCVAVRGYWQILDGFGPEHGVLAEVFRTGEERLVVDVRLAANYVPAVPGVQAELCVPLRHDDRVIGGLNVESDRPLSATDVTTTRVAATVFTERLAAIGGPPKESPWQRLARRAAQLAGLDDAEEIACFAVAAACEVTGFDSAVLVFRERGAYTVRATCGPLGSSLAALPSESLPAIASWTSSASAAYTVGAIGGSGFAGHQALQGAGVVALASSTLRSGGDRHGFLLVANAQPQQVDAAVVEHLEVLAAHASAALHTASAVARLRKLAAQDALTGLGHGATFHRDLAVALSRRGRTAVVLIDLDDFKQINDTRGHVEGDRILVATAALLAGELRDSDQLYRMGGDEFAAILPATSERQAERVARRLLDATRRAGESKISIGVTVVEDLSDTDAVLSQADLALYESKRRGRDELTVYRPALRAAVIERARLVADLASAIDRDQLFCVYQPVVDLVSGEVLGLEALLRWQHPVRGLVPPLEFIPLAEEDGLIGEIGGWVLEEACRQLGVWQRQGWARQDLRIAVNVSAAELGPDLVDRVKSSLARHGLSPERLVVEVTESVFVDERQAAAPLQALRELGVHVAVDDFGTGYSSLSYLHRLPIDILKIDRAFVTGIAEPTNLAVARAVVELGNSLGLSTVAEGIEEPEQVQRLRKIGCEQGQGYLWSPPVPAAELPTICRRIDAVGRASRERQQVS